MSNFQSSASSRNDIIESTGGFFQPQILQQSPQFAPPPPLHDQPPPQQPPPPASKKRSLPGNPDPDAEVIALSPKSLQATNRFLCEICNKGFQRDQNLQLHRRGHNLPWKLKQRSKGEVVRKKVYVCPEPSCVHHHPSRALGDLTGIKKHFFRKHGEKKWKCDKCTKRYAVQSDWKAHSKVCGTREYKCDCGTIFSRRDSFITHRAFCDALAQETSRPINGLGATNALLNPQLYNHQLPQQSHLGGLSIKRELQDYQQQQQQQQVHLFSPTQLELFFSGGLDPNFPNHQTRSYNDPKNFQTSSVDISASNTPYHMSATALLQRAAQMGPTMSQPMTHQGSSGFAFPSAGEEAMSMSGGNGFFGHGNGHHMMRDPMMTSAVSTMMSSGLCYPTTAGPGVLEGLSYSNDFDHDGLVGGMLNNTQNMNENEEITTTTTSSRGMKPVESTEQSAAAAKRKRSNDEGMTRDFLGLKDASGFDLMRNSSTSSDHVKMSNNGGQQQVMQDNRDQNNDQYTYFGRVE